MPLNWDISHIENYKELCWDDVHEEDKERTSHKLNPVTEVLIFATMAVGINEITKENSDEFYARLNFVEKIDGPSLIKNGEPANISFEDVNSHIGLTTNASEITRSKFLSAFGKTLDRIKKYK
jgi:hypothetical protein